MVQVSGFGHLVCYFSRQKMEEYAHKHIFILIAKLGNDKIYYYINPPNSSWIWAQVSSDENYNLHGMSGMS